MKHSYILLSSLVLLACCTNENEFMTPETAVEGNTALVATAEQSGTRANYVKNDGQFFWTKGDRISVTTTTGRTSFGISSGAGTATAIFLGNLGEGEEITGYAWYNGHRSSTSGYGIEGDSVLNCWLDETYWIYQDFDSEFNTEANPDARASNVPLFAKFDNGEDLNFKMLCGAVAIQLKNLPENARWITFSTDKKIRGEFNVDITAKNPQINTTSNAGGGNSVKVYVEIGAETENCVIYLPLPCGTYEKFEITVSDEDNNPVGYMVSEKTRVVNRCQIRYFSNTEVGEFGNEDITEAIEDPELLSWLLDRYDRNEDGRLSTVEAWRIENINFDAGEEWIDSIGEWMPAGKIRSLKGIEYLQNLREINLSRHQIDSADFSKNSKLEGIYLESNPLKSIDVTGCTSLRDLNINNRSKWMDNREVGMGEVSEIKGLGTCTNLYYLHVENNQFESLDLSNLAELRGIYCVRNLLTNLDVTNCEKLEYLWCYSNQLTALDLSKCTELNGMNCGENQLTNLDVTNCIKLERLYCNNLQVSDLNLSNCAALIRLECTDNKLTKLDVTNCIKLEYIRCNSNQLTAIGLSNLAELREINCGENQLTNLDVTNCIKLERLYCNNQQISDLNLSNCTELTRLECTNNQLTKLDLTNCTKLEFIRCNSNQLTVLDLGNLTELREIHCGENQLTKLDVSNNLKLYTLWAYNNPLKEVIVSPEQDTSNFHYTIYDFNGSGDGENADTNEDEFK